jgi:hypothetical protein
MSNRALPTLLVSAIALSGTASNAQTVQPPAAGPLRPYVFPAVEQFQLANGLKVILVEKHTLPIVEGRLIVDAGAMREPAAKNGLASLTGDLLSEGTGAMSGADIARAMDALGAQYEPGAGFSTSYADVVALKNVFPQAMALAAKTVIAPSFPASEFGRVKNEAIANYRQRLARTSGLAFDAVLSVDEVKVYKPAPVVYQLAVERLGASKEEIGFVSSNCWDALGAKSFGFQVWWINRGGAPVDRLDFSPDAVLSTLGDLKP